MTTDQTLQSIADVLAEHTTAYHPGQLCPEDQHGHCATKPRPVPSPEDRMRDARTDTAFHRLGQQVAAVIQPAASFATYLDATERDQLDARAAAAEQERDDALDDLREARAEAANLRKQLDAINTDRQRLQTELDTMTEVAQGNKRHVAYLTAVIEAIANVEPHIHNGDAGEDNCSPYCPGCRIRTAMNATPPSSVPPRRAQDADLEPWIRRAAADPGSIAGRRRGPSWGEDEEGYAEEQETVPAWIARAVLRVLAKDGQPHCERCSQVIRVNDLYDPPLPGIGLWEHKGDCPPDVAEHGCDDCSVEPGERHRYAGCPGNQRAEARP